MKIRSPKVVNMSSNFIRRRNSITINFLNCGTGCTLYCKIHFLLNIVIFGVNFSELEILQYKFYFFISFVINCFSNTLSCIQDLNNLEKNVTMIFVKVIINVLLFVLWKKMHIITWFKLGPHYTNRKILKHLCWKWPCILHLELWNKSYGQNNGNNQIDNLIPKF